MGESVQGYNLFAYCFNNPINFIDQNGDWPNFIKRVVHTVKTFVNTILSPFKATEVSIGAGVGIGVQAKASYNGSNLKVEAVAKNADSINWSKKGVDVRNTSTAGVTLTVGHMNKSFNYTKGHSYHDKNCTCNVFKDSFNKKMNCPAVKPGLIEVDTMKIEFGMSAYLLLGAEVSISIDLNEWENELIDIFNESIQYED